MKNLSFVFSATLAAFALCGSSHTVSAEPENFRLLFNGRDLSGWRGGSAKISTDGSITTEQAGALLSTKATYNSYILDLDFLHETGSKGELGLHFPRPEDVTDQELTIQLYDSDTSSAGSLKGLDNARVRALKPAGEWNDLRVILANRKITVILNGVEVLNSDLGELAIQHPDHHGLKAKAGHIALSGDQGKNRFRNINIVEIPLHANEAGVRQAGFQPLIVGSELTGWRSEDPEGKNHWFVANKILKYPGDHSGDAHLWTKQSFKDFTLVFDWRWAGDGELSQKPVVMANGLEKIGLDGKKILIGTDEHNSGVFLRGSKKSQVNLWNRISGSGEIHGYRIDPRQSPETREAVTPMRRADHEAGSWNRMMIQVKGQTVNVSLNSDVIIENAILDEMPLEGPIGFQSYGYAIDFANIWVRCE
ncbi:DUF1080 domain-containing protein [Luteolibacter algae]|uniref:DUF1080 domain-containing protein n=1 Tax=Luteolibacter algae TaxID=454151 RepID=A0ABW5D3W8_9BACT